MTSTEIDDIDHHDDCPYCVSAAESADRTVGNLHALVITAAVNRDNIKTGLEQHDFEAISEVLTDAVVDEIAKKPVGDAAEILRLLFDPQAIRWHWHNHPADGRPRVSDEAEKWRPFIKNGGGD